MSRAQTQHMQTKGCMGSMRTEARIQAETKHVDERNEVHLKSQHTTRGTYCFGVHLKQDSVSLQSTNGMSNNKQQGTWNNIHRAWQALVLGG